jgi:RHS repeat-associated protein
MILAAMEAASSVFPLAAIRASGAGAELARNSHQGLASSATTLRPAPTIANSNTASGLRVCLYDSGRRSRSTGKERDADTGLDYFEARYFSSAQGRFTTPDEPLMDQDVNDPQSWNLYGYVRNNPLRFTDPTGQACVSNGSGGWKDDDSGGQSCADVDKANREKKPDVTVTDNAEPITWSQYFGFDRAYNRAVEQQVQIDVNAGRWDRVPVLRGEIPVGPPGAAGRFLFQSWNRATFANRLQSLLYHWRKHGRAAGKTFEQYAQDGVAFFNQNKSMATQVTLKDGTPGLLIRLGKGQPGGYFKPSGEVVTFWYK